MPPSVVFGENIKTITINLGKTNRGDEVSILQEFLIAQNKGVAARALGRVGATAYFGVLTQSALAEYQTQIGIHPALGNFGPITRAYLNARYQ